MNGFSKINSLSAHPVWIFSFPFSCFHFKYSILCASPFIRQGHNVHEIASLIPILHHVDYPLLTADFGEFRSTVLSNQSKRHRTYYRHTGRMITPSSDKELPEYVRYICRTSRPKSKCSRHSRVRNVHAVSFSGMAGMDSLERLTESQCAGHQWKPQNFLSLSRLQERYC